MIKKLFDKLLNKPKLVEKSEKIHEKMEDYGTGLEIGKTYLIIPKDNSKYISKYALELSKIEKIKSSERIIVIFYDHVRDECYGNLNVLNTLTSYYLDDIDLVKVEKRR